jgi:hypothetical protein
MSELSQFLYLSRLRGASAAQTVLDVVRQARVNNERLGVTGVLLFDGSDICQYIEGPSEVLDALVGRIGADARHEQVQVLHHAALTTARRFHRWRMGYVLLDHGHDLQAVSALQGEASLEAFLRLLPQADMEP